MKTALYILLFSALTFAACNRDYDDPSPCDDCGVYIAASLQDDVRTRIPYVPSDDDDVEPDMPTNDCPLKTEVWASSASGLFADKRLDGTQYDPINNPGVPYEVAYHTQAHFQSGGPQLLAEVIYSKVDTPPIYFVAMTPESGWTTEDGRSAFYLFHGYEDVMFAPQVYGSYGKKDSEGNPVWPTLHFRHLLTWLRLEIKAESEEVAEVWGKITDITVRAKDKVSVDLTRQYDPSSCVSFSGSADMDFRVTDSDEEYPASGGEWIPYLAMEEVAYVLCSPVTAYARDAQSLERVAEYTLDITTENRPISVPIDLKTAPDEWFEGSTMGKQFTISLTFRMGNNITTSVVVNDWIVEGVAGGNLYE